MGENSGDTADFYATIKIIIAIMTIVFIIFNGADIEKKFIDYGCEEHDINYWGKPDYCMVNGTMYEATLINEKLYLIGYKQLVKSTDEVKEK